MNETLFLVIILRRYCDKIHLHCLQGYNPLYQRLFRFSLPKSSLLDYHKG